MYVVYKKKMMFDPREMIVLCRNFEIDQGIAEVSVTINNDTYPPKEGNVRIDAILIGTFIKQVTEDKSELFSVVHADYKIPAAMKVAAMKFAANAIPRYARNLDKAIDNYFKS